LRRLSYHSYMPDCSLFSNVLQLISARYHTATSGLFFLNHYLKVFQTKRRTGLFLVQKTSYNGLLIRSDTIFFFLIEKTYIQSLHLDISLPSYTSLLKKNSFYGIFWQDFSPEDFYGTIKTYIFNYKNYKNIQLNIYLTIKTYIYIYIYI